MAALAHFGVGLAAKRIAPTVPLALLIAGALAIDLLFGVFFALGLEKMPASGAISPYSHSLFMAVVWSLFAGAIAWQVRKDRRLAAFFAALVFSHWVLDFISQPMTHQYPGSVGPPLFFEGSPTVGLGLYRTALGQNLCEYGCLAAGIALYVLALRKLRREKQAASASAATAAKQA
ncbi:MAG TPA: hypothetical protein VGK67_17360 [Myxococcales bacterium]|jgi:hypothetical protein